MEFKIYFYFSFILLDFYCFFIGIRGFYVEGKEIRVGLFRDYYFFECFLSYDSFV